jgi:serine protease DegS
VEPTGATTTFGGKHQTLTVVDVAADSPAQKAGVQVGDVITHIDGEVVQDGRLTMHRIAMLKPGDTVAISVQRNRQSLELNAVVGALNQSNDPELSR